MMWSGFIYVLLALGSARTGSAVPAPAVPSSIPFSALGANDSYAGVVRREDIPSGVEIRGIDDVAAGAPGSSSNPAAVLKRSDCNGSSFCHALSKDMCGYAISI
ncbi:hypothetical protein V8F33_013816 [Rhypophila sp. PSN 637]